MRISTMPLDQRRDAAWPKPAAEAAWMGLAGEFAEAVDPYTEGELLNLLVMVGNAFGRKPHFRVGATKHRANLNVVTGGETGTARKGTASDVALDILTGVDPDWSPPRNGLSTGEGLIEKLRDAPPKARSNKKKEKPASEPPLTDKRLLVLESEFGRVLRVAERVGNNLVPVLNTAWDGTHPLHLMTRNAPLTASEYHISLIGHITFDELNARLQHQDIFNGFANRFLWACVRRSKTLPLPPELPAKLRVDFCLRMQEAVAKAHRRDRLVFAAKAEALWRGDLYAELTRPRAGAFGAATDRAAPQVLRLALIYALLDCSSVIKRSHLEAAHAVWRYCEASAQYIFGHAAGGPHRDVDVILAALRTAGADGLLRKEVFRTVLGGHRTKEEVRVQLQYLRDHKFADFKTERTDGGHESGGMRWRLKTLKTRIVGRHAFTDT